MTLQALADLRAQQALSMSYFDIFWISSALGASLVSLVLLMKPSSSDPGVHVFAE